MLKPKSYYWEIEILLQQYQGECTSGIVFDESMLFWKKGLCFQQSNTPVFTDEKSIQHTGLKESSYTVLNKKYVFLTDNHQKVLTPFFWCFKHLKSPLHIVHIDAHRDDATFPYHTQNSPNSLTNIQHIESQCRVSDYLDAGEKIGIIQQVISVTQSSEFENFSIPKESYILNLDIDIFGPEGEAVNLETKVKTIALAWKYSSAVCIATSPGFIDQDHAQKIIEIFISSL